MSQCLRKSVFVDYESRPIVLTVQWPSKRSKRLSECLLLGLVQHKANTFNDRWVLITFSAVRTADEMSTAWPNRALSWSES